MAGLSKLGGLSDYTPTAADAPQPKPLYTADDRSSGLVTPGNIDLASRPVVKNDDGSISTVRSMSIGIDGKEVLIPTVGDNGKILSEDDAIKQFRRTGKHLGIFETPDDATSYARTLHNQQERMYKRRR